MVKLAIISSHPIQYNAPWFRLLAEGGRVVPKVFYTWSQAESNEVYDPGFDRSIQWDLPLLEGYEYCFVKNTARVPGTGSFYGLVNPTLVHEIEQWKADAVLVFGWNYKSHLECLRHFKGKIPVLFRGDSTLLDEEPGIKRGLRRLLLKWVYRSVDHALYVGTNNKNYFLTHGMREDQLCFAPHAIDNDRFREPAVAYQQSATELRTSLGFTGNDLVMVYAGKLIPKKSPGLLLRLMEHMNDPRLKLLVIGNGALAPAVRKVAAIDNRVKFLEFRNQAEMPVVYRAGNVFVLPSTGPGETWGLALNEAMACGLPVVATDRVGGAVDLVAEGRNGTIIKSNDLEALKIFIQCLLDRRGSLEEMGLESAQHIQGYTFQHIISAIENLLVPLHINRQLRND